MTQRSLWLGLAATSVLASSSAFAGAPVGSWYVAPQFLYVDPDSDFSSTSAKGGALGVGKVLNQYWDTELSWAETHHDVQGGGPKLKLRGPSLSLNRVFLRDQAISPFIGVGVNYIQASATNATERVNHAAGQIQAGLLADLTKDGSLQLTGQIGERADSFSDKLHDFFAGVGLRMNFGGDKPMAAAPKAVAAAPAAAPAAPVAPLDSDHDGVIDSQDQCPNTVGGAKVDAVGCELDGDKDGIVDRLDKCPGTPAGDKVDAVGCSYNMALHVNFDTNKATIKAESNAELNQFVQFLKDVPSAMGELQGHTDSDGSDKANMSLSQRRADSVKAYIVAQGIDAKRILAKGYGESQPIADNKTAEGKAANRRVVFVRSDK